MSSDAGGDERRHHLSIRNSLCPDPSRLHRGDLDGHHLAGPGHWRDALLAAHLRYRSRIPSLLLASRLFDEPGVPIPPRALLAQTTAQKSVIWWASKHRHHHLLSDTPQDVHSPRQKGFIYSHLGWIFAQKHDLQTWRKFRIWCAIPS